MSERLPYEEQLPKQWDELTLPGEDQAWEDMRQRLEEDDDDRFVAWWQRGCIIWGLLLLVLLAILWYILKPQEWFNSKKSEINKIVQVSRENKNDTLPNNSSERAASGAQSSQHKQLHLGDTL